jgi:hypothetical protein
MDRNNGWQRQFQPLREKYATMAKYPVDVREGGTRHNPLIGFTKVE